LRRCEIFECSFSHIDFFLKILIHLSVWTGYLCWIIHENPVLIHFLVICISDRTQWWIKSWFQFVISDSKNPVQKSVTRKLIKIGFWSKGLQRHLLEGLKWIKMKQIQFRWFNIKEIYTTFTISIMMFSNHLKQNSS